MPAPNDPLLHCANAHSGSGVRPSRVRHRRRSTCAAGGAGRNAARSRGVEGTGRGTVWGGRQGSCRPPRAAASGAGVAGLSRGDRIRDGSRQGRGPGRCAYRDLSRNGTTWFGTLHGNRGWRVEAGWLDEVQPQSRRIISYDDVRLAVADNSESADVTVELVDVGAGTRRTDYAGKDVRGKLVLCDATPSACHRQAVEELGAAGLVSHHSIRSALVARRSGSDPLGPPRFTRPQECVRDHDLGPRGARAAAAAGTR